jgi:rhamnosyltransferase
MRSRHTVRAKQDTSRQQFFFTTAGAGVEDKQKKNDVPKILVLLASYNGKGYIEEQIESIRAQQNVDVSIMISDDCSPDGTYEHVSEKYGAHPNIRFRRSEKPSGTAGANFRTLFRDVDVAGYDYVALADQDDIWATDKLETSIGCLESGDFRGYSCAVTAFWNDGREATLRQSASIRELDYLFEGAGQGCTFVVSSSLFEKVQQFCRSFQAESEALYYHDWLIYAFARGTGGKWYFDQRSFMRYRQHGGNETGARGSALATLRRLKLIRNGWYGRQIQAAVQIVQLSHEKNGRFQSFCDLYGRRKSVLRRIALCMFLLRHGHRKVVDRAVLAFAAAMQWI